MSTIVTRALFKMLQKAENHIKTSFGVFDVAYGNEVIPTQGTGKGNNNDLTVWGLIH